MATKNEWKKLRYFKPNSKYDNWGDSELIDFEHLLRLDDFRHFLNSPVYVVQGVNTSGHATKSYHYPQNGACATDIVVPDYEGSFIQLVLDAERFGFNGLGAYPHWHYYGENTGGLHLDSRPLQWEKDETLNYRQSRWMGVKRNGSQIYIPLTYKNLLKYSTEAKNG